jgi:hypothetical protein
LLLKAFVSFKFKKQRRIAKHFSSKVPSFWRNFPKNLKNTCSDNNIIILVLRL